MFWNENANQQSKSELQNGNLILNRNLGWENKIQSRNPLPILKSKNKIVDDILKIKCKSWNQRGKADFEIKKQNCENAILELISKGEQHEQKNSRFTRQSNYHQFWTYQQKSDLSRSKSFKITMDRFDCRHWIVLVFP